MYAIQYIGRIEIGDDGGVHQIESAIDRITELSKDGKVNILLYFIVYKPLLMHEILFMYDKVTTVFQKYH